MTLDCHRLPLCVCVRWSTTDRLIVAIQIAGLECVFVARSQLFICMWGQLPSYFGNQVWVRSSMWLLARESLIEYECVFVYVCVRCFGVSLSDDKQ